MLSITYYQKISESKDVSGYVERLLKAYRFNKVKIEFGEGCCRNNSRIETIN